MCKDTNWKCVILQDEDDQKVASKFTYNLFLTFSLNLKIDRIYIREIYYTNLIFHELKTIYGISD